MNLKQFILAIFLILLIYEKENNYYSSATTKTSNTYQGTVKLIHYLENIEQDLIIKNELCSPQHVYYHQEEKYYKSLHPDGYKYFNCFGVKNKDRTNKYSLDDTQKGIINKASRFTNIPEIVLACLAFIESRFNPNAKSSVGAIGIGQFTPATLDTLRRFHTSPSKKALDSCRAKANLTSAEEKYCQVLESRLIASQDFNNFNKTLIKELPDGIKFIPTLKHSNLALSGYYLQYLLKQVVQYNTEIDYLTLEKQDQLDIIKLALAAYNAGPARVGRILSKVGKNKPITEYLVEVRKISSETQGHMDGIEDCVKNKSYLGPTAYERELKISCE
jgi:hypothetical protein